MCYGENIREITFLLQVKPNKPSIEIQNNTKLLELNVSIENFLSALYIIWYNKRVRLGPRTQVFRVFLPFLFKPVAEIRNVVR